MLPAAAHDDIQSLMFAIISPGLDPAYPRANEHGGNAPAGAGVKPVR